MANHSLPIVPRDVVRILSQYRQRWIVPTALIVLAALAVAIVRKPSWEASQALVLREEGAGRNASLGRFDSVEAMKTAQETIMELSKSHGVLRAALVELDGEEPTDAEIEQLQDAIKIRAPKGIEFGKSEVFYLLVKAASRDRARQLAAAVSKQLDQRLRELREEKAASLVNELNASVAFAESQLNEATRRLSEVEREVGSDLAELRILNESTSGESNLRQTLIQVKGEMRQAAVERRTLDELIQLLTAAQSDPKQLVATPNNLLQAQPALQRLKDGLVDSQLRAATLLGELSPEHPRVKSAVAAQEQIASRLHTELSSAITGIAAQRRIIESRITLIEQQQNELTNRMARIAELRPTYANLAADVRSRGEILQREQFDLSQAVANQQAARTTGQLTCLDEPATGDSPSGPSRAMIVVAGLGGGLLTGFGVLFLTVPLPIAPVVTEKRAAATAMYTAPTRTAAREAMTPVSNLAANHVLSLRDALKDFFCVSPSWN